MLAVYPLNVVHMLETGCVDALLRAVRTVISSAGSRSGQPAAPGTPKASRPTDDPSRTDPAGAAPVLNRTCAALLRRAAADGLRCFACGSVVTPRQRVPMDDERQYLAGLLYTLNYIGVLLSNYNLAVVEVRIPAPRSSLPLHGLPRGR